MKNTENIKAYSIKLLTIMNKIRSIREQLLDSKVVEKVLVGLLERFETKISSLEIHGISLKWPCQNWSMLQKDKNKEESIALEGQEQRRVIRIEKVIENAFYATNEDQTQ